MLTAAFMAVLLGGPSSVANADQSVDPRPQPGASFQVISDTEIHADGMVFNSWQDLHESGYFRHQETRCGTLPDRHEHPVGLRGTQSDCSFGNTNPSPEYDPSVVRYRIPVVFHVIQRTNGTGNLSDAQVISQIDILNEDFLALPGTNGAPGTDVQIEFYLATEDPNGNPTSGITRSTNNTWFNDGGQYYDTLAWDTNRYLNIYSNSASGALGYVPNLPQGGIAGSNFDRVVILYSTVGRNAPFAPFDLGRTGTHEVGHYFGLEHTFSGGCAGGNCYTRGDLICDTPDEGSPTGGCPSSRTSCGNPAPFHNYMDYSDDLCMWEFTPEQARRMRCSLENWRPDLAEIVIDGGPCSAVDYAEPFGELNFFDLGEFLNLFNAQDPSADLAAPDGVWNFFDLGFFLTQFNAGCP